MKDILVKIEALRKELHELAKKEKSFVDQEVLRKSQELDDLLNEYARILKERNKG